MVRARVESQRQLVEFADILDKQVPIANYCLILETSLAVVEGFFEIHGRVHSPSQITFRTATEELCRFAGSN